MSIQKCCTMDSIVGTKVPLGGDPDADVLSRRRRNRTVFTSDAICEMEAQFVRNRYPDIEMRESLATQIGVPEARIQVWFQNRRARSNKHRVPDTQTADDPSISRDRKRKSSTGARRTMCSKLSRNEHDTSNNQRLETSSAQFTMTSKTASPSVPAYPLQQSFYHPFVYPNIYNLYGQNTLAIDESLTRHSLPYLGAYPAHYPFQSFPIQQTSNTTYNRRLSETEVTSEEKSSGENFVDNLFRFSAPFYNKNTAADKSGIAKVQMVFPQRRNSSCSISELRVSEERILDSSVSSSSDHSNQSEWSIQESDQSDVTDSSYKDSGF